MTSSGEILEPHPVSPVERTSHPTLESVDDQVSPPVSSGEETQIPGTLEAEVTDSPTPAPTTESRGTYKPCLELLPKI